jgi:hypothetical protein
MVLEDQLRNFSQTTWYYWGSEVYEDTVVRHVLECEINLLENVHLEDRKGDKSYGNML